MATSIKDVMYSVNGEQLTKQKMGKDFSGFVGYKKDENGKVIYPEGKEWYVFKLVDNGKKGGVRLSNIDDVLNPVTGRTERIRLLNGVDSIWLKDQKDLPKDYEKSNWVELRFFRNQKMLRISKNHQSALEFLRVTNNNIGNPYRIIEKGSRQQFFEYDSALAEQEAYEVENFELEMALEAKAMDAAKMRKHAAFLGLSLTNSQGEEKTDDGVRKDYVMYAKRNPKYFKQTMGTKEVEIGWLIKKAIKDGLIDVGREPGRVFWSRNGGMIGVYPQTQNPEEYLRDLASMNTPDAELFKEQLKQVVQ